MSDHRHLWDPEHYRSNYDKYVMGQTLGRMHVISVHLWLEYILVQCLKEELPNPTALFGDRGVGFAQLVSLCEAHQVIDRDMTTALRSVNRMRNKCAHQLTFNPTDADWASLAESIERALPENAGNSDDDALRRLADHLEEQAISLGVIEPVRSQPRQEPATPNKRMESNG